MLRAIIMLLVLAAAVLLFTPDQYPVPARGYNPVLDRAISCCLTWLPWVGPEHAYKCAAGPLQIAAGL